MALGARVKELVPELDREDVMLGVVSSVLEQASSLTKEVEGHFKVGKNTMDVNAVIAVMVQGALAAICEGHPEEDVRGRLFQAGKAVGEFWVQRVADNVQRAVEEEHRRTRS